MSFEIYVNDYGNMNFSQLDKCIPNEKMQKSYFDYVIEKYSKHLDICSDNATILWSIRLRKALKEIFNSATFYVESKLAIDNGLLGAYYFLSYYSVFHAMLSTLYTDEKQDISKFADINHTKVINCFVSNFCTKKYKIFNYDAHYVFHMLKYLRESYSYSMPLNDFSLKTNDVTKLIENLEDFLVNCYQITSLHSLILEIVAKKKSKYFARIDSTNYEMFKEYFYSTNGKKHPFKKEIIIDEADKNNFNETRRSGCNIDRITLEMDYYFDEFRGYSFQSQKLNYNKYLEVGAKAYSFIYESIC